jgi:hypothetical protein
VKLLIENYSKITITYDQLDGFRITSNAPFILTVVWNGVKFEFLIRIKQNTSHLLILGSGAGTMANETRLGPPYFQRHSWINDFEDSVIYYNDPTLYLGEKLLLGWGQGSKDRFYLKEIATIIEKIIKKTQTPPKNVLFYGSSGGGFMSLILAGYIKESIALVNGPQTCLTKWLPVPVKQVFDLSYPNMSEKEVMIKFPERINLIKFFNQIKYVPKIYYLQNAYCELDIVDHVIPFIEGLQKMGPGCVVNPVRFDLYYLVQPGPAVLPAIGGHGALGKADTLKYIKKMKTEF